MGESSTSLLPREKNDMKKTGIKRIFKVEFELEDTGGDSLDLIVSQIRSEVTTHIPCVWREQTLKRVGSIKIFLEKSEG